MCFRYSNVQEEKAFRKLISNWRNTFKQEPVNGRFEFYHTNGFGHEQLPVVTQENPDEITWMNWGLIPAKTKSKADKEKYWKMGYTLNARAEEIFSTWSYKENIKTHRCLIPATGFFEWRDFDGEKYPYLVQVKSQDFPDDVGPFCFAGVYDKWVDKDTAEVIEGFSIITTVANPMLKKVHVNPKRPDLGGRMPVIVKPELYQQWLKPIPTLEELEEVMQPYPEDKMQAYTISKRITSRKLDPNDSETLAHVPYHMLGEETSFGLPFI